MQLVYNNSNPEFRLFDKKYLEAIVSPKCVIIIFSIAHFLIFFYINSVGYFTIAIMLHDITQTENIVFNQLRASPKGCASF